MIESSSSCSRPGRAYDVFLSFRGDTRKNFTDHLYTALVQAGIHTFRDDNELLRGEEISQQLSKAIQESRISIVVFSKGYASSRWCLNELVQILDCKHNNGQVVLPTFYDIDPADVRKQTGIFAEAFDEYESFEKEMRKVNKWRKALAEAANLSGWDLNNMENGHESVLIQNIVKDVMDKLNCKYLNVAKYPVGIDSRVDNIISLLRVDTDDVSVVGIHGMAGIGKTTLAKAIFNQICDEFEGSCFLLNVKEISEQSNGLIQLQEQLVCDILKSSIWKISNVDRGMNLIKERLCYKKVILVLDDVHQQKQLDVLVGERSWFGPGSKIIITTRNERLLTQHEVDVKYQAEELNQAESLQLFSWHAFKNTYPLYDYKDLSYEVLEYCGGVPLALEILGSCLFRKGKSEWSIAIEKMRKVPNPIIQEKLRISFESLDDDRVKGMFLDIACFFIGWDKEYVTEILGGRGYYPEIGMGILIERSLITINDRNEINMHDLIRDMGRELIRETWPEHPGKRSRIWLHDDAWNVLNKHLGTKSVEGLVLDFRPSNVKPLSTESLMKMRHLKLLQINGVPLTGCYKHLSEELVWLCWHECPLNSLPSDFRLDNLVILDMQYSNIKELWKEIKILNKMKILNLSYSGQLTKTPKFHSLSLKKLILEGCTNLVKVHQSIGNLESLVFLNLKGCCRLKVLPSSMCDLKSLETLNITMCSQLEKLPERLGDMESLTELLADGTTMKPLPSSIRFLKNLRKLSLQGCNSKQDFPSRSWLSPFTSWLSPRSFPSKTLLPASLSGLSSLRYLYLSHCGVSEGSTSIDLGSLSSLQVLDLSGNKFFQLPPGMGRLPKLVKLYVEGCKNLISISELPSSLRFLCADNCTSMERLSIRSRRIQRLMLSGCQSLVEIQGMDGVSDSLPIFFLDDCKNLSNNFKKSLVQALCRGERQGIFLPGGKIPDWFRHQRDGSSLSFHVPDVLDDPLEAIVVWVVFAVTEKEAFYPFASAIIKHKSTNHQFKRSISLSFSKNSSNHSWVNYIPFSGLICALEGGEELELSVETNDGIRVDKCGVHFTTPHVRARIYC